MILPITFFYFLFSCLFVGNVRGQQSRNLIYILFIIGLSLSLIAAFRVERMADRQNYIDIWNGWDRDRLEIGFTTYVDMLRMISTNSYWFLFSCATFSVFLKLWAINRMTKLIWASLLIYIANMFILHDMIQLRCAIASGFLLHAVYYLVNRNTKCFLLASVLAFSFHYSALIIFPLWFLNVSRSYKFYYIGLIFLSYIIGGSLPISVLIEYIPITGIQKLWDFYKTTEGNEVNIFNAIQLGRLVICIFLLLHVERISYYNRYAILLVKIYAISLSLFVLFSNVSVIAFRISELYQIVEILIIPMIVYAINGHVLIKKMIVVIIGLSFLLMNIFFLKYLK